MPESDVTITVNFKPINVPEETPTTPTENTTTNTVENVVNNTETNTVENSINESNNSVETNEIQLPITGDNTTTETTKDKANPKTGDDFICAYIILFSMSVLSLIKLVIYLKDKKN